MQLTFINVLDRIAKWPQQTQHNVQTQMASNWIQNYRRKQNKQKNDKIMYYDTLWSDTNDIWPEFDSLPSESLILLLLLLLLLIIIIIIIVIIIGLNGYGRGSTFVRSWPCNGPHQPRCAVVQLEAQTTHFPAHKTIRALWVTTSDQRWACLYGTRRI